MHLVYWGPHVRTLFWVYGVIRTLTSDLIVQVHSLECLCVCAYIFWYGCVFVHLLWTSLRKFLGSYFIFPDGVALVIKRVKHQSFHPVFFFFPFTKSLVSACVLSNKRSQGLLWVLGNALSNLKIDKSPLSQAKVNPTYESARKWSSLLKDLLVPDLLSMHDYFSSHSVMDKLN